MVARATTRSTLTKCCKLGTQGTCWEPPRNKARGKTCAHKRRRLPLPERRESCLRCRKCQSQWGSRRTLRLRRSGDQHRQPRRCSTCRRWAWTRQGLPCQWRWSTGRPSFLQGRKRVTWQKGKRREKEIFRRREWKKWRREKKRIQVLHSFCQRKRRDNQTIVPATMGKGTTHRHRHRHRHHVQVCSVRINVFVQLPLFIFLGNKNTTRGWHLHMYNFYADTCAAQLAYHQTVRWGRRRMRRQRLLRGRKTA